MKKLRKKYWALIFFSFLGILAGFLYWSFIGCRTGSCPITSNWYASSLTGGLIGYLLGDSLNDFRKKRNAKHERSVE